jgi:division protein CdvB (Snf7/Vps24/ESCRT-III family)
MLKENQRTLNRSIRELDREVRALRTQETKVIAEVKKAARAGQTRVAQIQAADLVRTRRCARLQAVSLRMQVRARWGRGRDNRGQGWIMMRHLAFGMLLCFSLSFSFMFANHCYRPYIYCCFFMYILHRRQRAMPGRHCDARAYKAQSTNKKKKKKKKNTCPAQTLKSTQAMSDAMRGVATAMRRMNAQVDLPAMQRIMMDFEREGEVMDMKGEMMGEGIEDAMGEDEDEAEADEVLSKVLDEIGIEMGGALAEAPRGEVRGAQQPAQEKEAAAAAGAESELQARLENLRKS